MPKINVNGITLLMRFSVKGHQLFGLLVVGPQGRKKPIFTLDVSVQTIGY